MPPFFGGNVYNPDFDAHVNDVVTMAFTYKTDKDKLADYLPDGFELLRPELNVAFCQMREVSFMAGGAYNLVNVSVPARFNGKRDRLEGQFSLVVWENNTLPIIGGREETGVPKIFANIQDLHMFHPRIFHQRQLCRTHIPAPGDDGSTAYRRAAIGTNQGSIYHYEQLEFPLYPQGWPPWC